MDEGRKPKKAGKKKATGKKRTRKATNPPSASPVTQTEESGRDSKGKFAKGNKGGPGNPRIQHLNKLQAAVKAAVTPADIKAVMVKLKSLAMANDVQAAQLYLVRALGKPREAQEAVTIKLLPMDTLAACRANHSTVLLAMAEGSYPFVEGEKLLANIDKHREQILADEVVPELEAVKEALAQDDGED